jgi:transposase
MKAYSLDLRQKLVERYEGGAITQRELARQFGVSPFFVVKVLRLRRNGEQLAAKRCGGARKPYLTPPMRAFVREQLLAENDLTLSELCERVAKRFQTKVSAATMCRALKELDLRRKKRVFSPASENQSE